MSPTIAVRGHRKSREALEDRVRLGALVENQLRQFNAKGPTIPFADEVWWIGTGRNARRIGCVARFAKTSGVIQLESS
ncbi:MAG: hypothetical protein ABI595_05305 [Actinomycetota bacterium]